MGRWELSFQPCRSRYSVFFPHTSLHPIGSNMFVVSVNLRICPQHPHQGFEIQFYPSPYTHNVRFVTGGVWRDFNKCCPLNECHWMCPSISGTSSYPSFRHWWIECVRLSVNLRNTFVSILPTFLTMNVNECVHQPIVVFYESRKWEVKIILLNEGRCDVRLKTRVEESTWVTYTGFHDKTN